MRRDLGVVAAVAAGLLLAAPAAAWAEKVAVLDVTVDGATPDVLGRFQASIEEGLAGAGFEVIGAEETRARLARSDAPRGCHFGPCLALVGQAVGADKVLLARVTADGTSFAFVLTLVDARSGAPVAQQSQTCAVCTFDEALAEATSAVVELGVMPESGDMTPPKTAPPRRGGGAARKAAWWMTGLAVVAAGAGGWLLSSDEDQAGWAAVGAAGGFAIAGTTLFVMSID